MDETFLGNLGKNSSVLNMGSTVGFPVKLKNSGLGGRGNESFPLCFQGDFWKGNLDSWSFEER